MNAMFSRTLSRMRQEKGVSQRQAAQNLGISQALLSHYENGVREPGLAFVVRACDYYQISADYLLGRTPQRESGDPLLAGGQLDSFAHVTQALCGVWGDFCRETPVLLPLLQRFSAELSQTLHTCQTELETPDQTRDEKEGTPS